eukprot:s2324_g9.t1
MKSNGLKPHFPELNSYLWYPLFSDKPAARTLATSPFGCRSCSAGETWLSSHRAVSARRLPRKRYSRPCCYPRPECPGRISHTRCCMPP